MQESWIAALVVLLPSVAAWVITGRLAHWRLPRGRWAELLATAGVAFVAYRLLGPDLATVVPPPWSGALAATAGAASALWVIVVVTAPMSAVAVIDCCSAEVEDDGEAALLRANAGAAQLPSPPYVHPYVVTLRVGGAVVWVWDNESCPAGTKGTIRFKDRSPFPKKSYSGTAPQAIVAKPLLHTGDFPYGLELEQPDGTRCSVDPIIHGRPG